jgi:3-keto-5-aminohexanoate cleavage enzyme
MSAATMTESYWDYRDIRKYLGRAAKAEWPPLIITVAITGGVQGKETSSALPEIPEEQAGATYAAYQAGASIVHVHARDPATSYAETSPRAEDFRLVNALIRDKCPDIIINNTTGGSFGMTMEQRVKSLDAMPEMASLNCGPNPIRITLRKRESPLSGRPQDVLFEGLDLATPSVWREMEHFAKLMINKDIKPEIEMYNSGHYWLVDNLIDHNLLKTPYFIQFVMGAQGGSYPTPSNVISLAEQAPQPCLINVAGTGAHQLPLDVFGLLMGFHVRTGLEDNLYYRRGELAKSNSQLVERIVRIAGELNREIASPNQARQMLGISAHPRKY